MKVLLITDIPNPYRLPLFGELNQQLLRQGAQLKVVFGSARQANRKFEIDLQEAQFEFKVLDSQRYDLGYAENTVVNYKGLLPLIKQEQPDRIITIGFTLATMKVWWHSFWHSTPYFIWGGSTQAPGSRLRKIQRRLLAARAKGAIAYGSQASRYFQTLGLSANQVFTAINTTDTTFFAEETQRLRSSEKNGPIRLTAIGYLTERKNPGALIEVVKHLAQLRSDFQLDLVGDGELREELERSVSAQELTKHVVFHGFRQKKELPQFLAQSNVFLFPTHFDIWGLVLVEAMAAGLPCFASPHAGATEDLIEEGETGFRADFSNPELVAKNIHELLNDPERAQQIGQNAANLIANKVSIPVSAAGFVTALSL